jgi:TolB protein
MTRLTHRLAFLITAAGFLSLPVTEAAAQDTSHVKDRIRVGVEYQPGVRPGLVVLPGPGLDSVRVIVRRDLDYSDRFEMVPVDNSVTTDGPPAPVNYGIYKTLGVAFAVELVEGTGGVTARLHDVARSQVANQQVFPLPPTTDAGFRLDVHRMSDEIARWATGTVGVAATRILFVSGGRIFRMDSDGADLLPLTPAGQTSLSPAWSPDGQQFAYTQLGAGRGGIVVQSLANNSLTPVPGTQSGLNITPVFSPDGKTLAYAHSDENGTDVFTVNVVDHCCAQRLTVGRYADNLSATFSPDGRRIAFVSTRAGPPQIYVMAADGTDQELLAQFDFGVSGASNAPEWSPDGASVVFHREVDGSPQIFLVDVAGHGLPRQMTSAGRNEDATWAPDGRHIAFVSDRSGFRQLWVLDAETGRVRQLISPGAARLPSWSRRLGRTVAASHP